MTVCHVRKLEFRCEPNFLHFGFNHFHRKSLHIFRICNWANEISDEYKKFVTPTGSTSDWNNKISWLIYKWVQNGIWSDRLMAGTEWNLLIFQEINVSKSPCVINAIDNQIWAQIRLSRFFADWRNIWKHALIILLIFVSHKLASPSFFRIFFR